MFQLSEEDLQGKGDSPLGAVNNLNDQADLVIAEQQRLMTNTYVEMDKEDVLKLYLEVLDK